MPESWNLKQAAALLRRATFGFTAARLYQALSEGPERTQACLHETPPDYAEFERTMAALTPRESNPATTAQLTLYRILHSPHPYREKSQFTPAVPPHRVKSPLEFALNLAIPLGVQLAPSAFLAKLTALGQRIPQPADPELRWLNSFTLIGRSNLAAEILAKVDDFPDRKALLDTLLQDDPPALASLQGRDLAQAIANLPEFQLL